MGFGIRLCFSSESEEKLTKSGDKMGQIFTFKVDQGECAGNTISVWLCSRTKNSSDSWMEERTKAFFARIAQVCGIPRLTSTQQLQGHPFVARIVQEQYDRTTVDRETEEVKTEKAVRMAFAPGKFPEIIMSVSDYESAHAPAESAPPRKFVKAARPAKPAEERPAVPADAPAEEVPW